MPRESHVSNKVAGLPQYLFSEYLIACKFFVVFGIMMSNELLTNIPVLEFNGKKSNFIDWELRLRIIITIFHFGFFF
mgnify:CR=1 FL=1